MWECFETSGLCDHMGSRKALKLCLLLVVWLWVHAVDRQGAEPRHPPRGGQEEEDAGGGEAAGAAGQDGHRLTSHIADSPSPIALVIT